MSGEKPLLVVPCPIDKNPVQTKESLQTKCPVCSSLVPVSEGVCLTCGYLLKPKDVKKVP